ncbi:MAG: acyltransferase [Mucinivorans sp.]
MTFKPRLAYIDYLKCVCIILMVVFHLVYISDKYPYIKQLVYTFHMPTFLIISGYLANVIKKKRQFTMSILWIFIPYAIMETGYVLMSSVLPVRESVDNISILFLLDKVFLSPMGPYWYLHTFVVCCLVYYVVDKISARMNNISSFIILGLCFWILSYWFNIISMANAIYFMIGVVLNRCRLNFLSVFQPSAWALVPLVVLCAYPTNLNRYSLAGIVITYLFISLFLCAYRYIPEKVKSKMHFVGMNTLPILLFSPIFTILSKALVPLFSFDPSGLIFMCVAVTFVISGCFFISWLMDRMNLSRYFCGKCNLLIR